MDENREMPPLMYLLVCRNCWNEQWHPNPFTCAMPFPSAEARGRWASAHTEATGHTSWWVYDAHG